MSTQAAHIEHESAAKPSRKVRLRTLADLDKRTVAARAALDLRDSIIEDLGGADAITTMQRAIIDNTATLGAALTDMAASYLAGEGTDLALYATLANAQRRLLADLGLERRARDVTPTLNRYIQDQTKEAA